MYRACSICGKIHPAGQQCKSPRSYAGGEERKLRSTNRWKRKSEQIRDEVLFCEVCKDKEHRYVYDNLEVHHIEKLKNNKDKLLDDDNLIVLCREHHRQADSGELSKDYLRELVRLRLGTTG